MIAKSFCLFLLVEPESLFESLLNNEPFNFLSTLFCSFGINYWVRRTSSKGKYINKMSRVEVVLFHAERAYLLSILDYRCRNVFAKRYLPNVLRAHCLVTSTASTTREIVSLYDYVMFRVTSDAANYLFDIDIDLLSHIIGSKTRTFSIYNKLRIKLLNNSQNKKRINAKTVAWLISTLLFIVNSYLYIKRRNKILYFIVVKLFKKIRSFSSERENKIAVIILEDVLIYHRRTCIATRRYVEKNKTLMTIVLIFFFVESRRKVLFETRHDGPCRRGAGRSVTISRVRRYHLVSSTWRVLAK